jgi:hypothetical protein
MDFTNTELTAGAVAIIIAVAQLVGKAIPDTATGLAAIVRKIAKVIGLYTPNNTGK